MQTQTTSPSDEPLAMAECEVVEFNADHIDGVTALGKQLVAHSPVYSKMEYHPDVVRKWLGLFLDEEVARGWVTIFDGDVVGMLLAGLYSKPPLLGLMASDEFLYIDPQYRSCGAADVMVEEYVQWARGHFAQIIMLCNTAGIEIDRTKHFYTKNHFECIGTNGMFEG